MSHAPSIDRGIQSEFPAKVNLGDISPELAAAGMEGYELLERTKHWFAHGSEIGAQMEQVLEALLLAAAHGQPGDDAPSSTHEEDVAELQRKLAEHNAAIEEADAELRQQEAKITRLTQQVESTVADSVAWVYYEVCGKAMSADEWHFYEPDNAWSYDRNALRREIAMGTAGKEAVDRAYTMALSRVADKGGLAHFRGLLATGELTYVGLVNRLLRSEERKNKDIADRYKESLRSSGSNAEPLPGPTPTPMLSNFLEFDREPLLSSHQFFAHSFGDAERVAMLERHRSHGMTHFHVQMALQNDYQGKHRFLYASKERAHVTHWLAKIREYDMEPVVWTMCDDPFDWFERGDHGKPLGELKAFWSVLIREIIHPLDIRYIVPGLETVEYWTHDQHKEIFQLWREACPDAQIIFHTWPDDLRWLDEDWMDAVSFQTRVDKPTSQNVEMLNQAIAAAKGKPVYAGEFSREGFSKAAQARAAVLLTVKGCAGTWTGGSTSSLQGGPAR